MPIKKLLQVESCKLKQAADRLSRSLRPGRVCGFEFP